MSTPTHPVTPETVLGVVVDAVVTVLEVDPATVTAATAFVDDLHADSLALVEIADLVEENLAGAQGAFHLDDDDIDALRTVGDVVSYAVARL